MSITTIVLIALALAMDAFAVSLSSGVTMCRRIQLPHALRMAGFFGAFQALMPLAGWSAGRFAARYIQTYDHWIAFGLLLLVGGKMVYEALWGCEEPDDEAADPHSLLMLTTLAFATSIDAAAVGVSLSCLNVAIVVPSIIIGVITFFVSLAGTYIGCRMGNLLGKKVEIAGGLILIGIGVKILFEHIFG